MGHRYNSFPERGDQRWAALNGLDPVMDKLTDFADGVHVQIGSLMLTEIGPNRFNPIKFMGLGRQARNCHMAVHFFQSGSDYMAVVDCRAVPDDLQQFFDLMLELWKQTK